MAEPFTSTASSGPRSYRGSPRPSLPQESLFADVSPPRRDAERLQRMQAEAEVQSCLDCCDVLAVQCGHLFCIGKMPVLTRVLVLWFWVLALTVLLALLTVYVALGPTTYSVSPTDSLLVAGRVSSVMCEEVTLESVSAEGEAGLFSAYLMDSQPSVDQRSRQLYEMNKDVFLEAHQKKHWKYNLLQGSVISAKVCSDDGSTLYYYIIKGQDNLRAWQSDPECSGCYIQRLKSRKCSDSRGNSSIVVRVDEADDYFFAVLNQKDPAWPTVDVSVNRSLYDTTLAIRSCEQSEDCSFPLNFAARQYVLFHAEKDWMEEGGELTTRCRPRVWTYVDVFLLASAVLGVSLSLLVCRCAKAPRTEEMQIRPGRRNWRLLRRVREGTHFTERSPLLGGRAPSLSSYSGGMQPPDYDDVVSKEVEDHPPPPYTPTLGAAAAAAPAPPSPSSSASTETSCPPPTRPAEPQDPPVLPIASLP